MKILNLKQAIAFGLADRAALDSIEDVQLIIDAKSEVQFRGIEVRAVVDEENRRVTYASSVEAVDRMGDLIVQAGWETKNYLKTGAPFFFNHATWEPPVGTVGTSSLGEAPTTSAKKMAPALIQGVDYIGKDVSDLGEVAFCMATGKGMPNGKPVASGVSVGFIGRSSRRPSEDELKQLDMPGYGLIFERQEQLELSQAPVPANPYALPVRGKKALVDGGAEATSRKLIHDAISHLVESKSITTDLGRTFLDTYGATPTERYELASARVKAFHDMGAWVWNPGTRKGLDAEARAAESESEGEPDSIADAPESGGELARQFGELSATVREERGTEKPRVGEFVGLSITATERASLEALHGQAKALVSKLGDVLGTLAEREKSCTSTDAATIISKTLAQLDEHAARMARLEAAAAERTASRETWAASPIESRSPTESAEPSSPAGEALTLTEARGALANVLGDSYS